MSDSRQRVPASWPEGLAFDADAGIPPTPAALRYHYAEDGSRIARGCRLRKSLTTNDRWTLVN